MKISQQRFAEELADKYNTEYGKSVLLSAGTGAKLAEFDKKKASGNWPFHELVGPLMWLSTQTRPAIPNAAIAVARYCAAPKRVHWREALDILEYVRRARSFWITFQIGSEGGLSLQAFADADCASKAADRRSVSGGFVICGAACVS